jgi:glycosyltransferase involved in cell wall biosynthesis
VKAPAAEGKVVPPAEHAGTALATLGPRVQYFGGQVTQPQMAEFYHAADAYVCPYRGEGFNLPALEAAACGLPIITTAGGPTDDFVTNEFALKVPATLVQSPTSVGGQEFKPNLDALAAHLRRVIKDSKLRESARSAGPAHTHANYTWAKAVDKLLSLV